MSKIKLPLAILALFFTGFYTIIVNADNEWGKYHWDLTNEEPLILAGTFTDSGEWMDSLITAGSDWNSGSLLQNAVTGGSNDPASCGPAAGRVEVCNDTYGENGWLGIASIWATRGKSNHITAGTVRVNDSYFNADFAGGVYDSEQWRDFVMCQEVGHTFGLDHQDEDFSNPNLGTCMDYTNDPGGIDDLLDNLHPNLHDFETLASIYEHVNSSSTDDGEGGRGNVRKPKKSTGGGDYSPEGPSDWGQAISQDAQGRNNVFERTLSNGQVLITHVLWAI
jgi:hypothetical protein